MLAPCRLRFSPSDQIFTAIALLCGSLGLKVNAWVTGNRNNTKSLLAFFWLTLVIKNVDPSDPAITHGSALSCWSSLSLKFFLSFSEHKLKSAAREVIDIDVSAAFIVPFWLVANRLLKNSRLEQWAKRNHQMVNEHKGFRIFFTMQQHRIDREAVCKHKWNLSTGTATRINFNATANTKSNFGARGEKQ